ncbi:hypothetical protein KKA27_00770 [Patescibacteria group bacterium]|nr:hypothetical protein [Patescibacteria group bacterium]MBU2633509.1 hypothetical protein [Patescibacteria group bacterium]
MRKNTVFALLILSILTIFAISGCASTKNTPNKYLSRSNEAVLSPFQTWDEIIEKYNKEIVVGKTTTQDLKKMGICEEAPNVGTLNWLSVEKIFIHKENINRKDLPKGVRIFLDAKKNERKAYELVFSDTNKHHEGNFWKHTLNFRKIERKTGWSFYGLILTVDNVVVYTLPYDGKANINVIRKEVNPLGPLQGLGGDTVIDGAKRLIW